MRSTYSTVQHCIVQHVWSKLHRVGQAIQKEIRDTAATQAGFTNRLHQWMQSDSYAGLQYEQSTNELLYSTELRVPWPAN